MCRTLNPRRLISSLPKMIRVFFFSFLVFLVNSCNTQKADTSGPKLIRVEFIDQPDPEAIGDQIASFQVIPIEFSKENAIGQIYSLAGNDKYLVAYTARERTFWIMDYSGRILKQIRKFGQGPAEYIAPGLNFTVDRKGNLLFIDRGRKLLMEYTTDGIFIRSDSVPPYCENLELLDDGSRVLSSMRILDQEDAPGYMLSVYNPDLEIVKKMFPFYTSWPMATYPPNLVRWDNWIGISRIWDYNYYFLKQDLTLDTLMIFDFGDNGYDLGEQENLTFERHLEIRGEDTKPLDAGILYPTGRAFLATNVFKEKLYVGIGSLDREKMIYRPSLDFQIIAAYRGFPVPRPGKVISGKIAGSMNAVDVIGFWEKYPEQKEIAEKEPQFKEIISLLDIENNPLIILFTLKN